MVGAKCVSSMRIIGQTNIAHMNDNGEKMEQYSNERMKERLTMIYRITVLLWIRPGSVIVGLHILQIYIRSLFWN